MKSNGMTLLLVVLCLALWATTPAQAQHERVIYDRTEVLIADLGEQAAGRIGRLGAGLLAKIATEAVDTLDVELFVYHNYHLFSTTTLDGQVVSLGVFHRVLISSSYDAEDVVLALARSPWGQPERVARTDLPSLAGEVLGLVLGQ
jgi:hypothetical protein